MGSECASDSPPGARRVPTGSRRACGDAVVSHVGPYINGAFIRYSQATCRAPSGPVVPNVKVMTEACRNSIWADGTT